MILTCPACSTRYTVPDGAVGAQGRQVRCANCGNSWFQAPEATAEFVDEEEVAIASEPAPPEPVPTIAPAEPAPEQQPDDAIGQEPTGAAESYDEPATAKPRRRIGLWLLLGLVALIAAAAAAWYSGKLTLPGVPQAHAAVAPLKLDYAQPERSVLESGNELLRVHGRVANPGDRTQRVPQIVAEFRNASGQVIHRFAISPPVAELGPGASAPFDSAETGVPAEAERLSLSLAPLS